MINKTALLVATITAILVGLWICIGWKANPPQPRVIVEYRYALKTRHIPKVKKETVKRVVVKKRRVPPHRHTVIPAMRRTVGGRTQTIYEVR